MLQSDQQKHDGFAPHGPANLTTIVEALNNFAPLKLAESWDNVGLLIEPSQPRNPIKNIFLTNDLTETVMEEAIDQKADLIISYHPPIFSPLKRITQGNWKERIISQCLENQIALYSPHTAWDAVTNGINDWLANLFDPIPTTIQAIMPHGIDTPTIGAGRQFTLRQTISFKEAIKTVKNYLNLKHVQIAMGLNRSMDGPILSVALCAGSGASVLKNTTADLFLTGEMSHHELLDAVHRNINVIICNHSNTERGYFKAFQHFFDPDSVSPICFITSKADTDPLSSH